MEIFITGVSGFVGRHLARGLLAAGHRVTGVGRRARPEEVHPDLTYLAADTTGRGGWQEAVARADAVINLAGCTIARRWNRRYKQQIYQSRIETTRNVTAAMAGSSGQVLLSASAIGFYGHAGDTVLTESSPAGDDFLARLAIDWEAATRTGVSEAARVVQMRFGVVLGPDGGAVAQMVPVFRRGLGGPIGSGRQWFSWIHIDDLVAAVIFLFQHPGVDGPVNFTAPQPVRQGELARRLGRHMGRPAWVPTPAPILRLALGELAETLLTSQRVVPERLLNLGFAFRYPDIDSAVEAFPELKR